MFNMSDSSRKFLEKHFPEIFTADTLDKFLLDLDAFITRTGLDENDDMTDFGHEATAVYDDIFYSN